MSSSLNVDLLRVQLKGMARQEIWAVGLSPPSSRPQDCYALLLDADNAAEVHEWGPRVFLPSMLA